MNFLEKYKPKIISDVIGNSKNLVLIQNWLNHFRKSTNKYKSILISGPPGIGKTTVASIILKENNYIPIEFNASEIRNASNLKEKMDSILNNTNILCMFDDKRKLGIIMDEIDGTSSGDRGGLKKLLSYIKSKKKYKNPIIFICNYENKSNILDIKKHSLYIKFSYPTSFEFKKFIRKILE